MFIQIHPLASTHGYRLGLVFIVSSSHLYRCSASHFIRYNESENKSNYYYIIISNFFTINIYRHNKCPKQQEIQKTSRPMWKKENNFWTSAASASKGINVLFLCATARTAREVTVTNMAFSRNDVVPLWHNGPSPGAFYHFPGTQCGTGGFQKSQ